jgi:hypothetical protein
MCPQLPRLSLEYSHKAGLQTVITGVPLQVRPVTGGSHAGPVIMGRNARGPLSWTRPHCGMTSSPVFVWCRSSEGCPYLFCLCLTSGYQRRLRARGGAFASEGPVRQSHLVPKTSLDGGDAALARSGSAVVFDVTVDGRRTVGLRVSRSAAPCRIAGFPKSRALPIKGGGGRRFLNFAFRAP